MGIDSGEGFHNLKDDLEAQISVSLLGCFSWRQMTEESIICSVSKVQNLF